MFDCFIMKKSAKDGKTRLLRQSFKDYLLSGGSICSVEDKLFLAKKLYDANSPATSGFPHLVARSLSGLNWEQFSIPAESSDLKFANKLLRKSTASQASNQDSLSLKELFEFFRDKGMLADACNKGNSTLLTLVHGVKVPFDFTSSNLGITHLVEEKTEKRVSQVGRNYLVFQAMPADSVRISVVKDPELKLFLDGTVTISRSFYSRLVRGSHADRELLSLPTGSFRGYVPGLGMIKAVALIADRLPGGVDIIAHDSNIKDKEVAVTGDTAYFGWDPTGAKPVAYTDKQALANFSWFFGLGKDAAKSRVYDWTKRDLLEISNSVKAGMTPSENAFHLRMALQEGRIEESFTTSERFQATDWLRAGGRHAELPGLFADTVKNAFERICSSEANEADVRVKIPGSFYAQIVSLEAVKHIRPDLYRSGLKYGEILYLAGHQVFVVSNQFWADNLENWGGCDLDDKFRLIFRLDKDGKVCVFIYRTPNDRNEYALAQSVGNLPPLEGDWKAEPFLWPDNRPPQATTIKTARPTLGSGKLKPASSAPVVRTFEDFLDKVDTPSNPGWAINIINCYNSGYRDRCPLPSMESIVDLCQATRDRDQLAELESRCVKLLYKMRDDGLAGKARFDSDLLDSVLRVAGIMGYKILMGDETIPTYESPYAALRRLVHDKILDGMSWFYDQAPHLSEEAWADKLPRLRRCMTQFRRDYGDTFVNTVVDRVNKTFKGWSTLYADSALDTFRCEGRMATMGYELVALKQSVLLKEQCGYLWHKFKRKLKLSFRDFFEVVAVIALYQLFSQTDPDNPRPVIDLNGKVEKGLLVSDKRLFKMFLKVRSKI
jgi:hypothetical protein